MSVTKLWELSSKDFEQAISVEGRITLRTPRYQRILSTRYECPSCGAAITTEQHGKHVRAPSRCGCGQKKDFHLLATTYGDCLDLHIHDKDLAGITVSLRIQLSEDFLDKDTIDLLLPGTRVRVSGILEPEIEKDKDRTISRVSRYLAATNIEILGSEHEANPEFEAFLDSIDHRAFEELIAELFRIKGYEAKRTPWSGDYGIDVVAERGEEKIAIQCKYQKRDSKISNSVVQKALGAAHSPYRATKVMVITTAEAFSIPAYRQKGSATLDCELWNRSKLLQELATTFDDSDKAWEIYNRIQEVEEAVKKLRTPQDLLKEIIAELSDGFSHQIDATEAITRMKALGFQDRFLLDRLLSEYRGKHLPRDPPLPLLKNLDEAVNSVYDAERITTDVYSAQRFYSITIKEIVAELEPVLGREIGMVDVVREAQLRGLSEESARDAIDRLKRGGDLYSPRHGFLSRL